MKEYIQKRIEELATHIDNKTSTAVQCQQAVMEGQNHLNRLAVEIAELKAAQKELKDILAQDNGHLLKVKG